MKTEGLPLNDSAPKNPSIHSGSSSFIPHPSSFRRRRSGQTAIEYLLVTAALTIAFAAIYPILQAALSSQFRGGGKVILRMYKVNPW